jgi:hypothetical protein
MHHPEPQRDRHDRILCEDCACPVIGHAADGTCLTILPNNPNHPTFAGGYRRCPCRKRPTMHDLHEATEILLVTSREYGSSNARSGDVVAAAYRLAAVKLREHGNLDAAKDLDRAADQAEKIS